jgi:hypothetical protein
MCSSSGGAQEKGRKTGQNRMNETQVGTNSGGAFLIFDKNISNHYACLIQFHLY